MSGWSSRAAAWNTARTPCCGSGPSDASHRLRGAAESDALVVWPRGRMPTQWMRSWK